MKSAIFLFLILLVNPLLAQQQSDFAIYHDGDIGAWEDGIIAFEHFLDWKGVTHNRVTATDINLIELKDIYRGIFFPGGDADFYTADINYFGIEHIKELIADDGAYIGMCAGAEFACDKLVWDGITYDYPLNLFEGESIGPIDDLAQWPDYAMVTVSMNQNDEINQYESPTEDMLYWGGSIFSPDEGFEFDTVATFDAYENHPAIVKFNYESGRVLLISPHPEIEEDDIRDGVAVAEWLDDNGSDWGFLWSATDWLLGDSITNSETNGMVDVSESQRINIYPNPTREKLNIKVIDYVVSNILMYNQFGQEVFFDQIDDSVIDVSGLVKGLFLLEVRLEKGVLRQRFVID